MSYKCSEIDDGTVVHVPIDRLDAAAAVEFRDDVRAAAGEGQGRVVLDVSSIKFMDSSGLGAVVSAWKMFGPERPLEIANPTELVSRVLELTRMNSVITIHQSFPGLLAGTADAE